MFVQRKKKQKMLKKEQVWIMENRLVPPFQGESANERKQVEDHVNQVRNLLKKEHKENSWVFEVREHRANRILGLGFENRDNPNNKFF